MPLTTVVVDLEGRRWRVRSGLPTRPVVGDRVRYADLLELDVDAVVLEVGASGNVEVFTTPSPVTATVPPWELEERLTALRFRQEGPTPG
jgi:hypothetical protein